MKIVILSRGPELYSTKRLVEAAENNGHDVQVIDPLRCYVDITSHDPAIHYRGKELVGIDAVIPRIGASITFYGTAVVRQLRLPHGQQHHVPPRRIDVEIEGSVAVLQVEASMRSPVPASA